MFWDTNYTALSTKALKSEQKKGVWISCYPLAREGSVSWSFPTYEPDYFLSCGRQTVLCQDTCRDPEVTESHTLQRPNRASHPAGLWEGQQPVRAFYRTGDTVSHPFSVLLSGLPGTCTKDTEKELRGKRQDNVIHSRSTPKVLGSPMPLTSWPDLRFHWDWPPLAQAQQINFIHFCLCKPKKSIALKALSVLSVAC